MKREKAEKMKSEKDLGRVLWTDGGGGCGGRDMWYGGNEDGRWVMAISIRKKEIV